MSAFVYPYPRPSNGLLDGATDFLGGDPLQEPFITDYPVNADGHIIIPAADGGGVVTWVRGVWDYGTEFRYNDFMAGTTDPAAVNYMSPDSDAVATNLYVGGVYSTKLEPDWPSGTPAEGTLFNVRFSRRSGQLLQQYSAINGWPYNYVDPTYYGTAVDGDMYVMWSLALGYAATGKNRYKLLRDRIAAANVDASRPQGNIIRFDLPLDAEAGSTGLYEYYADTTPFEWNVVPKGDGLEGNCLSVQTSVISGGPPYNYAGWGCWQAWAITPDEPFVNFTFSMDGGGCGRNLELSTNVIQDDPAGDVGLLVPCLTAQAGVFTPFEFVDTDFWRLNNVVWEHKHKEPYWTTGFNGTFANVELSDSIALNYSFDFNVTPVYGSNLVTNGDFASGLTGWTDSSTSTGTATVSGGVCTLFYGTGRGRVRQGVTVEIGKTYLIEWTCSGFVAAEAFLDIGTTAGGFNIASNVVSDNGANSRTITATNTSLWLNFFSQTAGRSYGLDDVKIREVIAPAETSQGDIGINTDVCDSTGTTAIKLDVESSVTGTMRVTVRDAALATFYEDFSVSAGVRATHTMTWADHVGLVHPIDLVVIRPMDTGTGEYILYGCWYDDVVTMADLAVDVFDGFEFQFPSYDAGPAYDVRFGAVTLGITIQDGPVSDPQRYSGIPRWTYKWTMEEGWIGYGMWRGWSAPGYLWLGGWTQSGQINPDNSRLLIDMQRQFMADSQNDYQATFGGIKGPFQPRYGRASWEALNQEGIVDGAFSAGTYNQWYFPWDDTLGTGAGAALSEDWYGYTYRALLSCASDYYMDPTTTIKSVLDNWVAWFDLGEDTETRAYTKDPDGFCTYGDDSSPVKGIIWDVDHWHPPSAYVADGRVRYHYNPTYSYTCIAQAMLYKYWTDGDEGALKWLNRLLTYLNAEQYTETGTVNFRIRTADDSGYRYVDAGVGSLVVVQRGDEGEGYTAAYVTITGDGTGAQVVPRIVAGKIRYYEITNVGSGYTYIQGEVIGDGTGATVCLALYDQMIGALSLDHTGWDVFEIYNTYALLALGFDPLGTVRYQRSATDEELAVLAGLERFFAANTRDEYPMMFLANYLPMHEFGGWDPYHNGGGIDNPMIRDSRTRGKTWTETSGPAMRAAFLYAKIHGSCPWLEPVYLFHAQLSGCSSTTCIDDRRMTTPTYTAADIIRAAMRLIQVSSSDTDLTAAELDDGIESLNRMLDSWSADELMLYHVVRESFWLESGKNPYTIGIDGDFDTTRPIKVVGASLVLYNAGIPVTYPMQVINWDAYQSIRLKTLATNVPGSVYYDAEFPLASLYIYPLFAPSGTNTSAQITLASWKPLAVIESATDTMEFPPGYWEALVYNLAIRLAEEYQFDVRPNTQNLAAMALKRVKRINQRTQTLPQDAALMNTSQRRYNIYSDGF